MPLDESGYKRANTKPKAKGSRAEGRGENGIKERDRSPELGEARHVLSSSPLEHAQARDGAVDSEGIFVNAGKAGGSGQTGAVPQEPWEEGDMENVVKAARRVLARSQVHEPRTPNPVCSAGANVPITPHGGPATERPVTRGPGGGRILCAHAQPQTPWPGSTGERRPR